MQELCLLLGAQKTCTTPYHPASDVLVERFNRTLLMMLAMFVGEHRDDWDDLLPAMMMAYRSSVHESIGFSPYRLMFREECTLPMDVGLSRRTQDSPDPIQNPYALWVRDALEVAYDQVRCHAGQAVRRQKRLYEKGLSSVCLLLLTGLEILPPAKKCKLDSPWLGPYLVVSFAGWAVGVQLHPDSPVPMIHDKKIPRPRGLVSWLETDCPDSAAIHPVCSTSTVCRSTPGSAPSTVSGILSQRSLPHTPDTGEPPDAGEHPDAGLPVLLAEGSICVSVNHILHPFLATALMRAGSFGLHCARLQLPDRCLARWRETGSTNCWSFPEGGTVVPGQCFYTLGSTGGGDVSNCECVGSGCAGGCSVP